MSECWLPIAGYEGTYEVSDAGRVRSVRTRRGHSAGVLAGSVHRGYVQVRLSLPGNRKHADVHVLMAEAFIGPRPEGHEVRHLDGNKLNNALSNLAYGTRSDQRLDDVRNGVHPNTRKTRCPAGHPYDEANTEIGRARSRRFRVCRTCRRQWNRATKARARVVKAAANA